MDEVLVFYKNLLVREEMLAAEISSDAEEEDVISYEDLTEEEKVILNDLVEKCKNG